MSAGKLLSFKQRGITDEDREARRQALSARRRVENEKADAAYKTLRDSEKTRLSRDDANQMASNLRDILIRVGKNNWSKICHDAGVSGGVSTKNLNRYIATDGSSKTAFTRYFKLAEAAAINYLSADGDKLFFFADLIRGASFEPVECSINFNPHSDGWAKELCRALSKLERVLPSDTQELLEKCHTAKLVATKPLSEKPEFFASEDWSWHSMYFLTDEWVHDINLPDTVNTIPACLLGRTADFDAQCQVFLYKNILGKEQTPPVGTASISIALEFYYVYPADSYPFIAIKPLGEFRISDNRKAIKSIFRVNLAEDNIYKARLCIVTDTGTDKQPICPEVFNCSIDASSSFSSLCQLLEIAPFLYKDHEGKAEGDNGFGVKHADLIAGNELLFFIGDSYYCEPLCPENCLKYFRLAAVGEYHDFSFPSNPLAPELLPPAGSVAAHIIDNLRQPKSSLRFDQQLIAQYQHIKSELGRLRQNLYKRYEGEMDWLLDK